MPDQILGIDTGGTFTDAVRSDGMVAKLPSRPDDPSLAIAAAAERLAAPSGAQLHHGTTVATNAVLEGALPRVGLLVNEGFRDLLAIRRQARPELYAREPRRPALPLHDDAIRTVRGRIGADGSEVTPLDLAAAVKAGKRLARDGAEALAIVLLHAHAEPAHERALREALADLTIPVTASSDLVPEFREVERGVTTVLNAALRPVVGPYLDALGARLPDLAVRIMSSEGGLLSPAEAAIEPARLLLSGPAGGLVAATRWAEALEERLVLTLDMGGTSSDVALLEGDLPRVPGFDIAGHHVRLPSLAIHTVGAGGGSLVGRDLGGALTVGPASAGADPGPAAYGEGEGLTVTDAHLLLGHIDPETFAGGHMDLDLGHAHRVAEREARSFGLGLQELLEGVLTIADVSMARALRRISLERGRDPRGGALLVFGGAGGLHGASLARAMGLRRVLWPPDAGVLSAQGLVWTAPQRTQARTVLRDGVPGNAERKALAAPLVDELRARFAAEGHGPRSVACTISFEMRYRGQSYELEVLEGPRLVERFHAAHEQRFGFRIENGAMETVAVRVRASVRTQLEPIARRRRVRGAPAPRRQVKPPVGGAAVPCFETADLGPGHAIDGPAIVSDPAGTLWLDAGSRAQVHPTGAIVTEVRP